MKIQNLKTLTRRNRIGDCSDYHPNYTQKNKWTKMPKNGLEFRYVKIGLTEELSPCSIQWPNILGH